MPLDASVRNFLELLRSLRVAYEKLARSVPTPAQATAKAQRAYDAVILALNDPILRDVLDTLLRDTTQDMQANAQEVSQTVRGRRNSILREEARDAAAYGIKRSELKHIFDNFIENADGLNQMIGTVGAFEELLTNLHNTNLRTHQESLKESRKPKKARRRDLVRGTFDVLTGTAIVVANTKAPPAFVYSYALGGGSILEGMRNYLGEAPAE